MKFQTQHYIICKLRLLSLGGNKFCKMASITLTLQRKHFLLASLLCFVILWKDSFFFSNTFGLHLKFYWVRQKEIILGIRLHCVTWWPSRRTSLAVSDMSWSFLTPTSAVTSEDESNQTSENCSVSLDKDILNNNVFHFHIYHHFHRTTSKLCFSDQKSYWFAVCAPLLMWCTSSSLETSHQNNKILWNVSLCLIIILWFFTRNKRLPCFLLLSQNNYIASFSIFVLDSASCC